LCGIVLVACPEVAVVWVHVRKRTYYDVLGFVFPQGIRWVCLYSIEIACIRVTEKYTGVSTTVSVCYQNLSGSQRCNLQPDALHAMCDSAISCVQCTEVNR
jgi:hypothetical protein